MKYLLIILCLLNAGSCTQQLHEKENYMDIAVIRDVTDPHVLQPDANSILGLYNLSEKKTAAVRFRYREISDRILSSSTDFYLPNKLMTDRQNKKNESFFRERAILNFYDAIRKTLNDNFTKSDTSFLDHSECFETIAGELSLLSQHNSTNKVLIIFSNLFENSRILSVYRERTKTPQIQNPEMIAGQFEKTHLLPKDLKDINVVFVFKPTTREEDFEYLKMIDVYKRLLLPLGATIKVQANNSSYDL